MILTNILLATIAVLLLARVIIEIRHGKNIAERVEKSYAQAYDVENTVTSVSYNHINHELERYGKQGYELVSVLPFDAKNGLFTSLFLTQENQKLLRGMKKNTFNVRDNNGNETPLELKDKLVCHFADGRHVIMGESVERTFAIELKNPENSARFPFQGVHLTEGSLIAFYATMSIYFQEKGINVSGLLEKYRYEGAESIPVWYEKYDETKEKSND